MRKRVLSVRNICFSTEIDHILSDISFDLYQGEILGIVGINGVGKTLLAKIIAGLEVPDSGSMRLEEQSIQPEEFGRGVIEGIGYVGEKVEILPNLTVAENLFIGINEMRGIFRRRFRMNRMAATVFEEYRFALDPAMPANRLNNAQSMQLWLARLLLKRPRIIILDDITGVFSENEYENIRSVLLGYVSNGGTLICFSHNYSDIFKLANRILILRNNTLILEIENEEIDKYLLKKVMYGAESLPMPARPKADPADGGDGGELLRLERICVGDLKDLSLSVMRNEILGIIGINGCGKTDLIYGLGGVLPIIDGEVWLDGKRVSINSPKTAIDLGIVSCHENRNDMLFMGRNSIRLNVTANTLDRVSRGPFISRRREEILTGENCRLVGLDGDINRPMRELNNANLLKVALARCISSNPRLLLLDEPNKELDRRGIRELCGLLAEEKKRSSIVIALSKVDDVANICDRILIMHGGAFVASFDKGMLDYDTLMNVILSRGG